MKDFCIVCILCGLHLFLPGSFNLINFDSLWFLIGIDFDKLENVQGLSLKFTFVDLFRG